MRARFSIALLAAGLTMAHAADAQPRTARPGSAPEAKEEVSGTITSREARTEILPEPPAPGVTVEMAEGWYRIESGPEEPGATGSFTVMTAAAPKAPAPVEAPPEAAPPPAEAPSIPAVVQAPVMPPAPPPVQAEVCFEEKNEYARQLFRIAGIWYYEEPLAIVRALEETPGLALSPWVRFNLFGLSGGGPLVSAVGVDPVRPLGWDEKLRWAAEDLLDCLGRRAGWQ